MSENKAVKQGEVNYGYAYVVSESIPGHILGKILTLLETLGLPSKQEDAIKGLTTQAFWDTLGQNSVYITPERHNKIQEAYHEAKSKLTQDGLPVSAI